MPTKEKAPSKRELFVGCKSLVLRALFYLLVVVILVFNLFPFFCALLGSFRPSNALFSTDLSPKALNFDHYNEILTRPIFVEKPDKFRYPGRFDSIDLTRIRELVCLCACASAFSFQRELTLPRSVDEQFSSDLPAPGLVRGLFLLIWLSRFRSRCGL